MNTERQIGEYSGRTWSLNKKYQDKLLTNLGYRMTPKRIALIDDDEDFRTLIEHVGNGIGLRVSCFQSLEEMGSVAALGEFEGIILDFNLDKMNGIEIAEYIDALFPWIPAILTSGETYFSNGESLPDCVEGFVAKGCGAMNILKAISWAIDHKQKSVC